MERKTQRLIEQLRAKASPITEGELVALRRAFLGKLKAQDKTQKQWCEENDVSQHVLSNTLNRHISSRPMIALVARYVLNENWR